MAMIWPYSNISTVQTIVQGKRERYLLATAGARLLVTSVDKKRIVSEWNAYQVPEEDSRRVKRQKLEHDAPRVTNIILLAVNQLHKDFVVVTDNKYLHVLSLDEFGKVTESSQRRMPKRPCAVKVLPTEGLILCADKFGDVYSLPLMPEPEQAGNDEQTAAQTAVQAEQPTFAPSATELTVHTQRNRRALENQQRQQIFTKRKDAMDFKHELLLGHISMLTDLTYVRSNGGRIITADRDEHIRVSRAPPQAHIIEGFCWGHTEFISKLCPIPDSTLLVSGGGDDWLGIWDWVTCELQDKIELKQTLVNSYVKLHGEKETVAVSKMMCLPRMKRRPATSTNMIFVLCEHVNAILTVTLEGDRLLGLHVMKTEETPLDFIGLSDGLVVSFDVRTSSKQRLLEYTFEEQNYTTVLKLRDNTRDAVTKLNEEKTTMHKEKGLDEFLYYVENFRKRVGAGGRASEDVVNGEDAEEVLEVS
ncbi:hypothetical protein AMS68_000860 [Peltaster fructicola]|uniref:Uncharacterized protein n=1 Tax=Peltaster fructicola TaxID=286661 RepID=A0A6H0XKU2_9PEZI|nr:hypothetical protein AMS68_000860 [Peltaster fructicola]